MWVAKFKRICLIGICIIRLGGDVSPKHAMPNHEDLSTIMGSVAEVPNNDTDESLLNHTMWKPAMANLNATSTYTEPANHSECFGK